jgi:predicted kinase
MPAAPVTSLVLPEPCLVVLVGAAGSGKSTLAARLFPGDAILSSDAYRELVSGDPADQSVSRVAFSILHRELDRRLAAGRTTVVDATNVSAYARRAVLRRASRHGIPAIAIVLDLEPTLVQARNAIRPGRIVPTDAVEQQLASLARAIRRDELALEGFAVVHVVRTAAELDALEIAAPQAASR